MNRLGTITVIGLCCIACWAIVFGIWQFAVHWALPAAIWAAQIVGGSL